MRDQRSYSENCAGFSDVGRVRPGNEDRRGVELVVAGVRQRLVRGGRVVAKLLRRLVFLRGRGGIESPYGYATMRPHIAPNRGRTQPPNALASGPPRPLACRAGMA
jgi:hypothetical protein